MTGPSAKIVADSISPDGTRLTTIEATMHRFVLAELNTHRALSKNSASSRAIPVHKQIARLATDPALPVVWASEQRGMQGGAPLDEEKAGIAASDWLKLRDEALMTAEYLRERIGLHKSLVNRLLEPWMWHTVVCTGTAWQNFFDQRCSPLAQPEIRAVADLMKEAYDASKPVPQRKGDWHVPYFDLFEDAEAIAPYVDEDKPHQAAEVMVKVSAARCARVSYLTQDGKRDIQADLNLYKHLVTADPPHWSPLEHVATPWPWNRQEGCIHFGQTEPADQHPDDFTCISLAHLPRVGNLVGWRSLRTTVEAEQEKVTYR